MSERISQFILLCEDEMQKRLVWAFMKKCGLENLEHLVRAQVASNMKHGGNDVWVLDEFPRELKACRRRPAKTLLIVVIDADANTVPDRLRQLNERAQASELEPLQSDDPAVSVLVPRRNVETWIQCLTGNEVTEEQDYKTRKKPTKEVIRTAADELFEWSRPNVSLPETCVPSLERAFPQWRKIG